MRCAPNRALNRAPNRVVSRARPAHSTRERPSPHMPALRPSGSRSFVRCLVSVDGTNFKKLVEASDFSDSSKREARALVVVGIVFLRVA